MSAEIVGGIILKLVGAIAGTFLSLIFMLPRTMKEFLTRGGFTLVAGVIFAPQTAGYLGWAAGEETTLSSAAIAAFLSWWGLGAAARTIRYWAVSKMQTVETPKEGNKPLI